MSALDFTILFALLSAIAWGFSDIFAAKASKKYGPVLSIMVISIIELPIFLVFYFLHNHSLSFSTNGSIYAAAAGLTFLVASIVFFKALEAGPVSLVSPISSTYPLITTLIVILFFNAKLTAEEAIGIALIILGVMAASEVMVGKKGANKISRGVRLALITALIWGLGFSLLSQAVKDLGWLNASFVEICSDTVFACLLVPMLMRLENLSFKNGSKAVFNNSVWLNALLGLSGIMLLEIAISKTTSNGGAVATTISSSSPVLTMILALRHFKEKVSSVALGGAILGIAGVVVLSV